MTGTRILTFKAWREKRYVGLAEVLTSLGPVLEGYRWELVIDWLVSPQAEAITGATAGSLVTAGRLIELFSVECQLIDGELVGHGDSPSAPEVKIRAFDSGHWDVQTGSPELLEKIVTLYPDAQELPEW
ncbi:hypothetical protein [Streptosporangium minutum]|uniref:Uncharacterized protein n=1 Tax=Streptosporangium minutum TaxID=569862 RepID=A0A243RRF1_9ACTN|nr:hypothetical protein [Streptosporangium minutum]OUC97624.1 hypothetical protein CA984_10410 [Streptosporangium minutum]